MEYRTVAFIDANVALECLALEQLPWGEIDSVGPVLVLITPTVLKEVDSKKSHPRLADHARRFNATLRPLLSGAASVVVRERPAPVVHIALAHTSRLSWGELPDLDPGEADDRIVAEAMNCHTIRERRATFISQDIRPLHLAQRHGLDIHHVGENWLRPRQISEAERKAAALTREVATLKSREPSLVLEWHPVASPVPVYRVKDLTASQRRDLENAILAAHPMPGEQDPFGILGYSLGAAGRDPSLAGRYRVYADELVPRFARFCEHYLELMYNQVEISLSLRNSGEVHAESVLLRITADKGRLNDRPILVSPEGPPAPTPRTFDPFIAAGPPHIHPARRPRGRHEFLVEIAPHRSEHVQIVCDDFRHGSSYEYRAFAYLDARAPGPMTIEAAATAANLHGKVSDKLTLVKDIKEVGVDELIELAALRYKKPALALDVFQRAAAEEALSVVEFENFKEDI